jgi:hypothetical protein
MQLAPQVFIVTAAHTSLKFTPYAQVYSLYRTYVITSCHHIYHSSARQSADHASTTSQSTTIAQSTQPHSLTHLPVYDDRRRRSSATTTTTRPKTRYTAPTAAASPQQPPSDRLY